MNGIRFATEKDIDELKNLWKICFGDSDAFIQYYFKEEFKTNRVLLLEDKKIASMLTMIPIQLSVPNDKKYRGVMLYAVATHPTFQGKGLSTQLMDYAKSYLKGQGMDIITLVPASTSLADFYAKRGYAAGFYHRESNFSHKELQEYPIHIDSSFILEASSPSDYQQVRERHLSSYVHQSYDIDGVAYQKRLSFLSSCDIYLIRSQRELIGCAIIEKLDNNELFIKELLVPEEAIMHVMKSISNMFPSDQYHLRLPVNIGEGMGGIEKAFGMYQLLDSDLSQYFKDGKGYLGIAYD